MSDLCITAEEKGYLRDLAKKQKEYAMLPIMKEREMRWYRHNDLKGEIPMIHFETRTFEKDILPELKCTSEAAKAVELQIQQNILNHECIGDDRVVSSYFDIPWDTHFTLFDLKVNREYSKDSEGRNLGHHFVHPIKDLQEDLHLFKDSTYGVDKDKTFRRKNFIEELIGDILPVRIIGQCPAICLSQNIVHLMGMEAMIYALVDYPDEFHQVMRKMTQDYIKQMKWLEKEGLLDLNNGNNFVAQGTFGFTHDLPRRGYTPENVVTTHDLWGYMDSQETVSISPDMYGEFFFPYYQEAAKEFGMVNYGCCEPVNTIWEKYISKLEGLRKVSISPWCDEEYMGQVLKGSQVIYHRKPSPNFVGLGKVFDEAAYREHIRKTILCAKGCKLEFSFRDVYTLEGEPNRPRRAVEIVRELIEEHWT